MHRQVELGEDVLQYLFERDVRVEDKYALRLRIEIFEEPFQQRRLAGAGFADQGDESLALRDPVVQRGDGLAVARVEVEELRVRRYIKRPFRKLIELTLHCALHGAAMRVPLHVRLGRRRSVSD